MTAPHRSPRPGVVVVGAGVTGLAAARRLAQCGFDVDVFESSDRLGGQVYTVEIEGHPIDVGAEALHVAGPHVDALIDDLGLRSEMVTARPGFAWIWSGDRLRRMPAGVGPAGPTRLGPVLRSGMLSPAGLARAAAEPLLPSRGDGGDIGVGPYLAGRFGRQVVDRFVDPVLGSLHAGDVDQLSLRAATPYVAAQAQHHRSLLLAHRHRRSAGAPSFVTFSAGLGRLTGALGESDHVTVHLARPIVAVERSGNAFVTRSADGTCHSAEAVVLAVPAAVASRLLRSWDPGARSGLAQLRSATVATAVAVYPRRAVRDVEALRANGLLVPSGAGRFLKAATFLSSKWPHLDDPGRFLVRLSAGRVGTDEVGGLADAEVVEQLHRDLADMTGLRSEPERWYLQRWPATLARLEVGHLEALAHVRAAVAEPRVVLAGAAYDGLGVATCIAAGQRVATQVEETLAPTEVAM